MVGKGRQAPESGMNREIAGVLSGMLPYLSEGFCDSCRGLLKNRLEHLSSSGKINRTSLSNSIANNSTDFCSTVTTMGSTEKNFASLSIKNTPEGSNRTPDSDFSLRRGSARKFSTVTSSSASELSSRGDFGEVSLAVADGGAVDDLEVPNGSGLSIEQREQIRFLQVGRKNDFVFIERINGKPVNVLQGLELHTQVFSAAEQRRIVDYVYSLQQMGQNGQLRERTYSEPRKWMRGKGRVTIQFGCCYNYAVDKNGNPPGIIRNEDVDPLPSLFKSIIKRLVRWHVLPPSAVPNSCIVNIYEEGDCIPPHIDHHDFVRPFCTVSFLTECNILFGSNLKIIGPGEFAGPAAILLPVGSVLILNGNGADVAKHCVPGVPAKRISITFRQMDESKIPYNFSPDPELWGLQPIAPNKSSTNHQVRTPHMHHHNNIEPGDVVEGFGESTNGTFSLGQGDFPPLGGGGTSSVYRPRNKIDKLKQ